MIKTNSFTTNENIDLLNEISLVAPLDTPLLSMLLAKGQYDEAVANVVSWREKQLSNDEDITVAEGSTTDTFQKSTRVEKHNVNEIFKKAVSLSGSAIASDIKGINDLLATEVNDRLKEMAVNIEKKLTKGVYDDATVSGIRKMKGLLNFVPVENIVTEVFSEDALKATVKKLWDAGLATGEYFALVNADLKEQIDAIYKDSYGYVAQTNEFGLVVTKINTNYGVINLILDRHMPVDEIAIFDLSFLRLGIRRNPFFELLGKTGDSVEGQVIGELTIKVLNEKAISKFKVQA